MTDNVSQRHLSHEKVMSHSLIFPLMRSCVVVVI